MTTASGQQTDGDALAAWAEGLASRRGQMRGTRRIGYLEENVAAADISLTDAELAELDEAAPVGAASGDRYPAGQMSTLKV